MKTFRKTMLLAVCLLTALALALPAHAENTLTVTGNASVEATPDRALLSIGCSCERPLPEEAMTEAARIVESVKQAAAQLGIGEDDIVTQYLSFSTAYSYSGETPEVRGYSVTHMLSITLRDPDAAGKAIDALLAAGANECYGIDYATGDYDAAYEKALAAAVENAMAKADTLAIASGVWLGNIVEVREITGGGSYANRSAVKYEQTMDAGAGAETEVMAGAVTVSAAVEVTWQIR